MLGADLYQLWRAGRWELPALAGVYERAAGDLRGVRHDDAEWCALQRQLASVLAGAARQVEEAAACVRVAAAQYARADEAARAQFERLRADEPRLPDAASKNGAANTSDNGPGRENTRTDALGKENSSNDGLGKGNASGPGKTSGYEPGTASKSLAGDGSTAKAGVSERGVGENGGGAEWRGAR